ncbi:MAG: hypothetical protein ACE5J1_02705 [Nitrospiria bacterium]
MRFGRVDGASVGTLIDRIFFFHHSCSLSGSALTFGGTFTEALGATDGPATLGGALTETFGLAADRATGGRETRIARCLDGEAGTRTGFGFPLAEDGFIKDGDTRLTS